MQTPASQSSPFSKMGMKILIVDDHPIIRLGVKQLLLNAWPDATVLEADSVAAALGTFGREAPDAVVLDLTMPDSEGTEGAIRMLRVAGDTPILVLSGNAESVYASRLFELGVAGYLPKDRASTELVVALTRVLDGKRYVTPEMADVLVDMLGRRAGTAPAHERLSSQEHRVMLMMAAGRTPKEIAQRMHLSVRTVGTYRARILEKTGWKNNVELTKYCVTHGLTVDD